MPRFIHLMPNFSIPFTTFKTSSSTRRRHDVTSGVLFMSIRSGFWVYVSVSGFNGVVDAVLGDLHNGSVHIAILTNAWLKPSWVILIMIQSR